MISIIRFRPPPGFLIFLDSFKKISIQKSLALHERKRRGCGVQDRLHDKFRGLFLGILVF